MANRDEILAQLVDLTRYLGQPEKDYVILGEGNTSARLDEDTFLVKASGSSMKNIGADGFVPLRLGEVLTVIDQPDASDADITRAYEAARVDPADSNRPSLETILHALALTRCGATFVGHTHPTVVQALLCSRKVDEALAGRICSEEVTFCGEAPAVMPYADPGLPLALGFRQALDDYIACYGAAPKLVLIKNHGMVAIGHSPQEVKNITDMYVKVARVLLGTFNLGGPTFIPASEVRRVATRPDEAVRLKKLGSA